MATTKNTGEQTAATLATVADNIGVLLAGRLTRAGFVRRRAAVRF